jgi:hypothetical protein
VRSQAQTASKKERSAYLSHSPKFTLRNRKKAIDPFLYVGEIENEKPPVKMMA